MNSKTQDQLNKAKTAEEMLDILKKNYRLDKIQLGPMSKAGIILGLKQLILRLQPEERK